MKKYLETERTYLREFTESSSDIDALYDLNSDPDVMKYLANGKASTREEIIEVNNRVLAYYPKYKGRFGVWALHLKSNDEFMGFFILRPQKDDPDNLKFIELGYRLRKKFWRQGIATEVSKLLIDRCFKEYDVETVYADANIENEGSIGVMKKCGLKFEKNYHHPMVHWIPGDNTARYTIKKI